MRTLTEKYNGVLKGLFSKDQFLRDARMEQSQLVTQYNSYNDAVNILLNKGLISEIALEEINSQTIEYRGCIIEPGSYGGFEWHRPGWVDSKDEGGYSWTGYGDTVEQCKGQIDDAYDEYGEAEEEMAEKMGNPDHTAAAIPLEDVSLEEGPARNNPKIEKLVAGINDLIAQAVDSDGDPIGVVEPDTTWLQPYVYDPIQYKNGHLKITTRKQNSNTPEVDIILSRDMEFDGIPTLRMIMRMYKKAIKQAARQAERMPNQEPDYDEYYSESIKSDIGEKKLTTAEKAGKEKIVKSLAKAGMSKKDPKTYAIATTQAKELYEEGDTSLEGKYLEIVSYFNNVARSLDSKQSFELHNMLKDYFNRLFEGAIEEPSSEVKKGDVLKHKNSEVELEITNIVYNDKGGVRLYRGKITNAGTISGVEAVGKIYQIRPTLVGTTWFVKGKEQLSEETYESIETYTDASALARRLSRTEEGKFYIFEVEKTITEFIVSKELIPGAELAGAFLDGKPVVDNTLQEAKEEGYESPKPELPLDVLHHGIRFELDKKEIGNTPTEEEYMKAYKAATKNLEKDLLHYKKEEGAVESTSSKSDEMVKAKLKEGFKNIIRNILSENTSEKRAFDLNGKPL